MLIHSLKSAFRSAIAAARENRQHAAGSAGNANVNNTSNTFHNAAYGFRSHWKDSKTAWTSGRSYERPPLLNFAPRLNVARPPPRFARCDGTRRRFDGRNRRAGGTKLGFQSRIIRWFMLEGYMTSSQRRNPRSCPLHGSAYTQPIAGGNAQAIRIKARAQWNYLAAKQRENCQKKQIYKRAHAYQRAHQHVLSRSLALHSHRSHLPAVNGCDGKFVVSPHSTQRPVHQSISTKATSASPQHILGVSGSSRVQPAAFTARPRPFYLPSANISTLR